jgi:hypothetical protein
MLGTAAVVRGNLGQALWLEACALHRQSDDDKVRRRLTDSAIEWAKRQVYAGVDSVWPARTSHLPVAGNH